MEEREQMNKLLKIAVVLNIISIVLQVVTMIM